jgi:hypothetical protein
VTLQVQEALSHIRHTLGGEVSSDISPVSILNEAGVWLVNAHPWRWLERPSATLSTRATITITTGDWDASALTLTKTGAFSGYTFVTGDQVQITAGTGLTTGYYNIASKTSSDVIVLESSPGSTTAGTVSATMTLSSMALPTDFRDLVDIQPTEGLVYALNLTTQSYINQLRTNEVAVGNFIYWAAIVWGADATSAGGNPRPRLELYPTPTTSEADKFTLFYRAGWSTLSADDINIEIPDFLNTLYIAAVRAVARGYEEEDADAGGVLDRLDAIRGTAAFMDAQRRDSQQQMFRGAMRGGAVEMLHGPGMAYLKTQVQGPS